MLGGSVAGESTTSFGETPLATVRAAAQEAAAARVSVVLNPAPARPLSRTLLRLVTVLTPNETEAEMLYRLH